MNPLSAFSPRDLNAAVNLIPNQFGFLAQFFANKPIATGSVQIDVRNESDDLLPILSRYAQSPAAGGNTSNRLFKAVEVPKIPVNEYISPVDVDGVRAFGSNQAESLQALLADKMRMARTGLDRTLEYMRAKALQGVAVDHNGVVLADLYALFGVTKTTIDFTLGTSTTNVMQKCLDVARTIEDNLLGDTMTGITLVVSKEFFDKFTAHPNVKAAYQGYMDAANRLGGDMRKGFAFGGITLVEYNPMLGGSRLFAANKGVAFPTGTTDTFYTFVAPALKNDTVGSLGQLINMSIIEPPNKEGYFLDGQSCALPLCLRPMTLIECITSN